MEYKFHKLTAFVDKMIIAETAAKIKSNKTKTPPPGAFFVYSGKSLSPADIVAVSEVVFIARVRLRAYHPCPDAVPGRRGVVDQRVGVVGVVTRRRRSVAAEMQHVFEAAFVVGLRFAAVAHREGVFPAVELDEGEIQHRVIILFARVKLGAHAVFVQRVILRDQHRSGLAFFDGGVETVPYRAAANPQSPIPNPQSPIPNPQLNLINFLFINNNITK